MKRIFILAGLLTIYGLLYGCAPAQIATGGAELAILLGSIHTNSEEDSAPVFVEEIDIGNRIIRVFVLYVANAKKDFLSFNCYDNNGNKIGKILRGDQSQVKKYLNKMSVEEKKTFIKEQFLIGTSGIGIDIELAKPESNQRLDFFEKHVFQGYEVIVYSGQYIGSFSTPAAPIYSFQLRNSNGNYVNIFRDMNTDKYMSLTDQERKNYIQYTFQNLYNIKLVQ